MIVNGFEKRRQIITQNETLTMCNNHSIVVNMALSE